MSVSKSCSFIKTAIQSLSRIEKIDGCTCLHFSSENSSDFFARSSNDIRKLDRLSVLGLLRGSG